MCRPHVVLFTLRRDGHSTLEPGSPCDCAKQRHFVLVRSNPYTMNHFRVGLSGEPGLQIVWIVACRWRAVQSRDANPVGKGTASWLPTR